MNKDSGGDGIPVELFQMLKDDAVKMLQSIFQQIWNTQQWPQDWKSHSNPKERQCQTMFKLPLNCSHLTCQQGEGNGNPLQYSCLENPLERGALWAAVHRVAQSQTWMKRLSMHACTVEGNGNRLQHSCLENPRDKGAWWAAIHGIAKSQTRLK